MTTNHKPHAELRVYAAGHEMPFRVFAVPRLRDIARHTAETQNAYPGMRIELWVQPGTRKYPEGKYMYLDGQWRPQAPPPEPRLWQREP